MPRDSVEQRFSDLLDRLLAGEDVALAAETDAELRESLAFAGEMAALRPDPDEGFQRRLQARLDEQLRVRELEAAARGSFWDRLYHQPVWRAVAAAVFVIILGALLWRAGVFPVITPAPSVPTATTTSTTTATTTTTVATQTATQTSTPAPTTTQPGTVVSLQAGAVTDKAAYAPGDTVVITVTLTNTGPTAVVLTDMPPIVSILSADTHQPVYTFPAGQATFTLEKSGQASFSLKWDERDFSGQPVTGNYYIELEDLNYGDQPVPLPLQAPAAFDIIR